MSIMSAERVGGSEGKGGMALGLPEGYSQIVHNTKYTRGKENILSKHHQSILAFAPPPEYDAAAQNHHVQFAAF